MEHAECIPKKIRRSSWQRWCTDGSLAMFRKSTSGTLKYDVTVLSFLCVLSLLLGKRTRKVQDFTKTHYHEDVLKVPRKHLSVQEVVILSYYQRHHVVPAIRNKDSEASNFSDRYDQVEYTGAPHVLILTYMRSGSTLIGDILQHHANSTYAFEPLRFIEEYVRTGKEVHYLNGTHRTYPRENSSWVLVDMLYRWLTCDVTRINIMDLSSVMLIQSNSYADYYRCISLRKRLQRATTNQRRKFISQCIKQLRDKCEAGTVFIVKTIRFDMASAGLLLKLLPGLKVVHLLRDPRGKLLSEFNPEVKSWTSLQSRAYAVCNQIQSDILETNLLFKSNPNSIRILTYEQFSVDPILKSQNMFMFLNLTFTREMYTYVKSLTLQRKERRYSKRTWAVQKTNAKLTSMRWRLDMEYEDVEEIDQNCVNLYKTVGYVPMNNNHNLRNLSMPSQNDSLIKYMSL
ncbi:carbohydrate sulfotransferase 1-like [Argopecten irradians]|uniref:carbohydrate sulfotransferase 1-like n=1 Tax=Argopecten irradians TaxID=31199 RepID=UPI0037206A77